MNLQRRDDYKQTLYSLTPADGKTISNAALRESLKTAHRDDEFTPEDYWDLRNSLIIDGKLLRARGYGGSVRRALTDVEPIAGPETAETAAQAGAEAAQAVVAEVSLYVPFQKVIQTGYVLDNDLNRWVCEITASQGKRNTGGLWTRPDVTLIAEQTFAYIPDKLFDVITFEIKPNIETAMAGVYEAAAHSAFAHRSYLAFPDSKEYEKSPLFDRIRDECERFGLGLILFEDVADWDKYNFEVSAERNNPDPQAVNDFIKSQISEKGREAIQRWFH
jgi:hypothetical protein